MSKHDDPPMTWPPDSALPEGMEWVAAFKQPLPMASAGKLCKLVAEAYGKDARLVPGGRMLYFAGRTPDFPALPQAEACAAEGCGCGPGERPTAGPVEPQPLPNER